jgi:25S rRNA (adenine2142-N1)-methyltransferase
MGRGRKLFTGNKPVTGLQENSVKSRRIARKVTSAYHRLQNEIASSTDQRRITQLQTELEDAGGVDRYQKASVISTNHFKTSRWVVRCLFQLQALGGRERLKTLEVGAINTQLHACKHLAVRSIDLHSQVSIHLRILL